MCCTVRARGGVVVEGPDGLCFRGPEDPIELHGIRSAAHRRVSNLDVTILTDATELEAALDGTPVPLDVGPDGTMRFVTEDLDEGWHTFEVSHGESRRITEFAVERLTPATWSEDIAPLVEEHCSAAGCHDADATGDGRPDLSTYATWVDLAETVRTRVAVTADMPPPERRTGALKTHSSYSAGSTPASQEENEHQASHRAAAGYPADRLLRGRNARGDTDGVDTVPGGGPESSSASHDPDGQTDGDDDDADDDGDSGSPNPDGEGPAELPQGRAIRRMTADQYVRSLEKVTGQAWADFELYAAAMGKADYAEITEHDRTLSVTFEKFANDAAITVCRDAVDTDVTEGRDTILRFASVETDLEGAVLPAAEADVRANIQYLFLRFLADEVELDSSLIDPWADLVLAPVVPSEEQSGEAIARERWAAVCVGLATHVDFLTY